MSQLITSSLNTPQNLPSTIMGIDSVNTFNKIIQNNNGILVIKFGAKWCGPCKEIEPHLQHYIKILSPQIQFIIVDVDKDEAVYSFLRNKKMVNGIPVLLAYYKENKTYVPDDITIGANTKELELFFKRCYDKINTY